MVSKTYSDYRDSPADNGDHCAICVMFQPPDKCTKVDGAIKRRGWCKFFEEKK